jgi:hypothetical protein
MNIQNYWIDIDDRLNELLANGFVKLPSLKGLDLDSFSKNISREMHGSTFFELCDNHKLFLEMLEIDAYLTPRLYDIAKDFYNFKGKITDQYHIARKVIPGNVKEMYRAHFDSHLFTLVLPIQIPSTEDDASCGELIYFPNSRKHPKNEIQNIYGKAYNKRYASKEGLNTFSVKHQKYTEDFSDLEPLLFLGNTTLHTNKQVNENCDNYRLTLLAHFFDPSPKYGIGSFLRFIRSR